MANGTNGKKYKPKVPCSARRTNGQSCGRPAIRGGRVCHQHGGAAPQVRRKANERLADLIDPDRALREAARIAYSDPRALFDEQGRLKPVKQWPADVAASIGGIEVVKRNVDSADGKTDDVIKVKVWDKPKALEMLFKHLNLFKEQIELSGGIEIRWKDDA